MLIMILNAPILAKGINTDKKIFAQKSIGVYIQIPPVQIIEVDKNDNILRILSNSSKNISPQVRYNGQTVPINKKIQQQYDKLLPIVNWNGVGIRYERENKISPNIKINSIDVKTKLSPKNLIESQKSIVLPDKNKSRLTRVIYVDKNDKILRVVSNTFYDPTKIQVRKMSGAKCSKSIPINKKIQQQYDKLLPVVNWNGVGIRYSIYKNK